MKLGLFYAQQYVSCESSAKWFHVVRESLT